MTEKAHAGRLIEADQELRIDLGGQGVVAQDLEGAELGQHHQPDQHRPAEDGQTGLADGDPPERLEPTESETPGHLFLRRVGVAQVGRHREVDERVHGQRHDQHGGPEPAQGREQRVPAETDHEVRDAEGDHDGDGPNGTARDLGAFDEPGRHGADGGGQDRDHHGQADGVPDQGPREMSEEQSIEIAPPDLGRLHQEEGDGQEDGDGDNPGQCHQGPRQVAVVMVPVVMVVMPIRTRPASTPLPHLGHCSHCNQRGVTRVAPPAGVDGAGAGAQLRNGDRVGLQLVERCLGLRRRDAGGNRVFEALAVGDDLLPRRRVHEGEELLGLGLVLGGAQDGGAGDIEHIADVVRGEVSDLRVHGRRTDLRPLSIPVVLVDDPERHLPPVDLVGDGLVVRVDVAGGVALQCLQPAERRRVAVGAGHRRDDGLEVGLRPRQCDLALPLGLGQVHGRFRQLAGRDQRRVVDDDTHSGRDAHPLALRRVVLRRRVGQGAHPDAREQPLGSQKLERRRVLREEHIGRRAGALGDDLLGQDVLVIGPDVDRDAGLLLEGRYQ